MEGSIHFLSQGYRGIEVARAQEMHYRESCYRFESNRQVSVSPVCEHSCLLLEILSAPSQKATLSPKSQ